MDVRLREGSGAWGGDFYLVPHTCTGDMARGSKNCQSPLYRVIEWLRLRGSNYCHANETRPLDSISLTPAQNMHD